MKGLLPLSPYGVHSLGGVAKKEITKLGCEKYLWRVTYWALVEMPLRAVQPVMWNIGTEEQQNVLQVFLKNWRTLKTRLHGFLQNCARPKKGVQKDKRNQCWTELIRGYLASLIRFPLLYEGHTYEFSWSA